MVRNVKLPVDEMDVGFYTGETTCQGVEQRPRVLIVVMSMGIFMKTLCP